MGATTKSLYKLSDDLTELLDIDFYDVIINVGDENDYVPFNAHSLILRVRSEYFRAALSTTWSRKNSDGFYIVNLYNMNISYDIFGELLCYIYGGYVSVKLLEVTEKLQLMTAADALMFDHLIDLLEEDLIYRERDYINNYTSEVLLGIVQIPRCKKLLKICEEKMLQRPQNLFFSIEFLLIPRDYLVSLLKRNVLGLHEVTIWNRVINWCIHNTPNCKSLDNANMANWTAEQIDDLKTDASELLELIRFFKMDPKWFNEKVAPYKQIFEEDLYDEIIRYHENPLEFEPTYEILPSRLNSTILNESYLKSIASLIDLPEEGRSRFFSEFIHTDSEVNYEEIPYEFHILYRSQGKKINKLEWCKHVYNQGPTLTIIKTNNDSNIEFFGGYKSVSWSEENNENGNGGDGFTFIYYENCDFLKLQWVKKHFAFDMYLGGDEDNVLVGRGNIYNFSRGNKLYVNLNDGRKIDTIEVFKVVKK